MCEEEREAGPIQGAGPKAEIDVDAIHWGFLKDACCLKDVHNICLDKKRKKKRKKSILGVTGEHKKLQKYLNFYLSSFWAKENISA